MQGTIVICIIFSIYCILVLTHTNSNIGGEYFVHATTSDDVQNPDEDEVILNPIIENNPSLKVEEVLDGLDFPTSMAFLGPDDILVLEKNEGTVRRVLNEELLEKPLLNVNVANEGERGMLGIAIAEKETSTGEDDNDNILSTYVFLYYTESADQDDGDDNNGETIRNRLYRYELDQDKQELVNPRLLLDLPAIPGPTHNGGKIAIGPDNNVYLMIGDVGEHDRPNPSTIVNNEDGPEPDGEAGILRVTQDGEVVQITDGQGTEIEEEDDRSGSILGDEYPLNLYYAYGIRNSFGMDFDPVTGKLWDVETGRNLGEEVNLVEPGFNSGWMKAQGIWELNIMLQPRGIALPDDESFVSQLVDFDGRGKYSSPEFTWGKMPIATSGAAFFHSDRLGKQYENDLFVGEFVNGIIFDFDLSEDRTQLSFDKNGPLKEKVADNAQELEGIIFGHGFGGITDIKIGSYDGYLYVLSLDRGGDECKPQYPNRSCISYSSTEEGHIFRIVPASN